MSEFNHHGNRKPFAVVLCHSANLEKLRDVFSALESKGLPLCVIDEKRRAGKVMSRACGVISVFSESFNGSETLQSLFLSADSAEKTIVPLRADDSMLPELFSRLAYTNNSINLSKYTPQEAADRILTAPCFDPPKVTKEQAGAYKRTAAALICAAIAAIAVVAVPLIRNAVQEEPVVAEEETSSGIDADILNRFGLTEEDLAEVTCFYLAGDRFVKEADAHTDLYAFLYEDWDDDKRTWRWSDDGSEVKTGTTTDFSFLTMLPNLQRIILVNQSAVELPNLSSLEKLNHVELFNCGIDSLECLRDCKRLQTLRISLDQVTDLSPLSGCTVLNNLFLDHCENLQSLEGLETLTMMNSLSVWGGNIRDISPLAGMEYLAYLGLGSDAVTDYSPLADCSSLQELQIENHRGTVDLSFVSVLTHLRYLRLWGRSCSHMEALADAGELSSFELGFDDTRSADLSGLSGTKLSRLALNNVRTDFAFLKDRAHLEYMNISGSSFDWRGLEKASVISEFYYDGWGRGSGDLLDHLRDTTVKMLYLSNCGAPDLTKLPDTVTDLTLDRCSNESIEELNVPSLMTLNLSQMNRLASLKGIESLNKLTALIVSSSIRMTDWSALYEREIKELFIQAQFELPDFSRLSFSNYGKLSLDSIPGLTEVSCLDALPDEYALSEEFILELKGSELFNLSALERFSARKLTVSPALEDQAADLVGKKCFRFYNVDDSDHNWDNPFENFTLESLDELYTLPDALLAKLTRLTIGGNDVYNDGWMEWNGETGKKARYSFRPNGEDEESIEIEGKGEIHDFSVLSKLTGLEELILVNQPLESVDGIQHLANLRRLDLVGCDTADLSPVFALSSLEQLRLENCPKLTSLDGIQNLLRLRELNTKGTPIADYSPIGFLNPNAYSENGFQMSIMGYEEECRPKEYSFLAGISNFSGLELHGCPADEWLEYVQDSRVQEAYLFNCFDSQEEFERFISGANGLQFLCISWNDKITDLSCLANLDGLEYLCLSYDMKKALSSLDGIDYSFELEIEG